MSNDQTQIELNSLGLAKSPADTRVVVAMSGGVDSSVVAALLKDQGYDVVGITLQLYDHGIAVQKKGACCAGQDIHDARRVSEAIGIPHYVLDYESRFKDSVMEDFADSYIRGETPIPCVRCNQEVKFKDLLITAKDLNADLMATGHYVQRSADAEMLKAVDESKDQSYFLFATDQEQLDFLRFPLGGMVKDDVRMLAEKYGLSVADKPDSQDICFVPTGGYADVIERLRPGAGEPGDIVDMDGNILGQHKGIIYYTIGQRRGIGIGGGDPLYVIKLVPDAKQIVVGPKAALEISKVHIKELNWLGEEGISNEGEKIQVKVRSTSSATGATLFGGEDKNTAYFILDNPEYGVAAGQAAVFYDAERLLGGGWITKAISSFDA
ncbi:MAG: tRNA 2-thiouridine(34) synthase MnmA [Kordiimonadaceae bacterium]|jgi:tRNA-uridine 2-sulfurtransferase|nr:tRNA 2-thiouridine(34) synthase MnmA [Kordiimonadaceae bacterium]MBT6030998.1 tRNA 2-thiouridine(34) synthase MnmA [Kordiimonadaceae bacterium]